MSSLSPVKKKPTFEDIVSIFQNIKLEESDKRKVNFERINRFIGGISKIFAISDYEININIEDYFKPDDSGKVWIFKGDQNSLDKLENILKQEYQKAIDQISKGDKSDSVITNEPDQKLDKYKKGGGFFNRIWRTITFSSKSTISFYSPIKDVVRWGLHFPVIDPDYMSFRGIIKYNKELKSKIELAKNNMNDALISLLESKNGKEAKEKFDKSLFIFNKLRKYREDWINNIEKGKAKSTNEALQKKTTKITLAVRTPLSSKDLFKMLEEDYNIINNKTLIEKLKKQEEITELKVFYDQIIKAIPEIVNKYSKKNEVYDLKNAIEAMKEGWQKILVFENSFKERFDAELLNGHVSQYKTWPEFQKLQTAINIMNESCRDFDSFIQGVSRNLEISVPNIKKLTDFLKQEKEEEFKKSEESKKNKEFDRGGIDFGVVDVETSSSDLKVQAEKLKLDAKKTALQMQPSEGGLQTVFDLQRRQSKDIDSDKEHQKDLDKDKQVVANPDPEPRTRRPTQS